MSNTTHNLKGCRCSKGSDIRFCLGDSINLAAKPVEHRCEKTLSGKHMFRIARIPNEGWYDDVIRCLACGIFNDLDTKE